MNSILFRVCYLLLEENSQFEHYYLSNTGVLCVCMRQVVRKSRDVMDSTSLSSARFFTNIGGKV